MLLDEEVAKDVRGKPVAAAALEKDARLDQQVEDAEAVVDLDAVYDLHRRKQVAVFLSDALVERDERHDLADSFRVFVGTKLACDDVFETPVERAAGSSPWASNGWTLLSATT